MNFKEMLDDIEYIPKEHRDNKYWKLTIETLDKMCDDKSIFVRGMLSVIVSEYLDKESGRRKGEEK